MDKPSNFYWIGCSDHLGVQKVGGRLGAAKGPGAFLKLWNRITDRHGLRASVHLHHLDRLSTTDLAANHSLVAKQVRDLSQKAKSRLVLVGGGHDYAYPLIWGIKQAHTKKKIGCINIDAHFDLRDSQPFVTSGSPFHACIENKLLLGSHLIEFGIQDQCNAPELWAYAKKNKIETLRLDTLRNNPVLIFQKKWRTLSKKVDQMVLSLDLDALSQAFCPGVSAPQAEGFNSTDILSMVHFAAKDPKTVALGIFELNPELDRDDQTARVAVQAAFEYFKTSAGF